MADHMPMSNLSDDFNQDLCCFCLVETPSAMSDALGVPWCVEHRYRGQFLNWGASHDYPSLAVAPFAVAHGAYFWYIAATQGSDEYIGILLGAIELLYGEVAA